MIRIFVIGLALLAATLFLNLGTSHAAPSLRAAENWCKLHPDARESGEVDEHLLSIPECADRLIRVRATNTWTDAHAYCGAVGTIDAPDSRYVGPKEPHGLRALFFDEIGDRTDVILEWRCMGGAVYACGSGNSPICGKMTPYDNLEEIKQFCRETPNDYPPAAITGRFPVIWVCKGGAPYIADGDLRVDRRGYPVEYWKWFPAPTQ